MKIFIDDERPCPDGYELARTGHELYNLIRTHGPAITEISFDYYLNASDQNINQTGHDVSRACIYHTDRGRFDLSGLEVIRAHSDNHEYSKLIAGEWGLARLEGVVPNVMIYTMFCGQENVWERR